ncbi:MAG TPA: hypothetical protein VGM51_18070 [Armatimonadota bacterium]|jgi:hypothetical protein
MKGLITAILGGALIGSAHASIIFQAEPPAAPTELPAVQLAPVHVSRQSLQMRGGEFGIRSAVLGKTPRGLVLRAGSLILAQDLLGSEFFADTARFMAEAPGEAKPLPDTQVLTLANEALRKRIGRVSFSEVDFEGFRHLNNQGQDLRSGQLSPPTQDETIVLFSRMINGYPVLPGGGVGEHIQLHFDNFGALTGQQMMWRNAMSEPKPIPILPYTDVQNALIGRLKREMGNSLNDAIITRIQFGYFGRPEGQRQGWFQPAYLFTVELFNPEEKQTTAARLIPIPAIGPTDLREPLELPSLPSEQGSPAQVTFKATPPQLAGGLPTYEIVPNLVNVDTITVRARELGISSGTAKATPRGLSFSDGRYLLALDPAGSELFSDTTRMLLEAPGQDPPQSDTAVLEIALGWLTKHGVPSGELGAPVVRRLMHQVSDTIGGTPLRPTSDEAIVEYPRIVRTATGAAIPAVGEGAFFQVHIDNLGQITGHHLLRRQTGKLLQTVDPRPITLIQDEFLRYLTSELGTSLAMVTDICYGLYFRPEGIQQAFAQPVLLYDVDIEDPVTGEVTAHRQIPVPAGQDLMEPLDDPADSIVPISADDLQFRDTEGIPVAYGDVDGDGSVTALDVALILRSAGGVAGPLDPGAVAAGDVSPAGFPGDDLMLQVDDALRVLRSIYQLDNISNGP